MQQAIATLRNVDALLCAVELGIERGHDPRLPLAKARLAHAGIAYVRAWLELLKVEQEELGLDKPAQV